VIRRTGTVQAQAMNSKVNKRLTTPFRGNTVQKADALPQAMSPNPAVWEPGRLDRDRGGDDDALRRSLLSLSRHPQSPTRPRRKFCETSEKAQ